MAPLTHLYIWIAVPSSMTDETFWTRYFFRIHRIDQEEAARRVVLSKSYTPQNPHSIENPKEGTPFEYESENLNDE
jgi:hypothetical protein